MNKQSVKCKPYLNKEYPESEEEDKLDAWQVQEDTVVPYTVTDQPDTMRVSDWLKMIWPWPLSVQLESQLFGREQFPSGKWYQKCHRKTIYSEKYSIYKFNLKKKYNWNYVQPQREYLQQDSEI